MTTSDPLAALRAEIDSLDDQIIALLARRYAVLADVVVLKKEHQIPHRVESRVQVVLDRNEARGVAQGLPEGYARRLYELILEESHRFELPHLTS